MFISPLTTVITEPMVRAALLEDLGRAGDITTKIVSGTSNRIETALVARESGLVAGLDLALLAFRLIDPWIEVRPRRLDGSGVTAGEVIATVAGPAGSILAAERVALNFLCHLSGIATTTARVVASVRDYPARIATTWKTLPGLRTLQNYAVRVGGGVTHHSGPDNGVHLSRSHIRMAGGIHRATERARDAAGPLATITAALSSLAEIDEALEAGVDAVLLADFSPADLRRAVARLNGRLMTEATGQISAAMVREVAASGVDIISLSWLTQSAAALEISLDQEGTSKAQASPHAEITVLQCRADA